MAESSNRPGHETRDLNFRTITLFGGALLLVLVIAGVGLALLYTVLTTRDAKSNTLPSMVTPQLPPEPRLEVAPGEDMQALQATEDKQLSTYGWVDRQHG